MTFKATCGALCAALFAGCGTGVAACDVPASDEAKWISDDHGCKVFDQASEAGESVTWNGACHDGYADGPGALRWFKDGKLDGVFTGTLVQGKANGKGSFDDLEGARYDGDWVDGKRNGQGKLTFPNGGFWNGYWVDDKLVVPQGTNCCAFPQPLYPKAARRSQEEGVVVLGIVLDANGTPRKVKIELSSGYKRLDDAAKNWMLTCHFKAATRNGKPEGAYVKQSVSFRLHS